jgi:hypothetical protein
VSGTSGTVGYHTTVTKSPAGSEAASMDGRVCITNTGTHDTRGLAGTIDLTAPPDTTPITNTALEVSTEQVIPAGLTRTAAWFGWHQSAYDVGSGRIAAPDSSTSAPATTKPRSTRTAKPAATSANSKPSDTPSPSPRPHDPHPHSPAGHQVGSAGAGYDNQIFPGSRRVV